MMTGNPANSAEVPYPLFERRVLLEGNTYYYNGRNGAPLGLEFGAFPTVY